VRSLPLDRQQQVLDFVEFLQSKSSELTVTATIQPETPMANADIRQGRGWPPGFIEEIFGSCKDDSLVIDSEGICETDSKMGLDAV
jgi:hypothetical protein